METTQEELVKQEIKRCREQECRIRAEHKHWERIDKLLLTAEQNPFTLLAELEALQKLGGATTETVTQLWEWVNGLVRGHLHHYGELLRKELADCQVEGRFPKYRINAVLELVVDERTHQAKISTRFHRILLKGDISVPTVVVAVRQELKRLFNRTFKPEDFLEQLLKAYRLALVQEGGKPFGQEVKIFTVHKFVVFLRQEERVFADANARRFQPYLPDEFAVDLGRLLQSEVTQTPQGYRLRLHPVRNPKDALFVVNFATMIGQNYGLLSFQKFDAGR